MGGGADRWGGRAHLAAAGAVLVVGAAWSGCESASFRPGVDGGADGAPAADGGGDDLGVRDAGPPDVGPEDLGGPDATAGDACASGELRCDGLDDDCDGEIDEGLLQTFYEDFDGDGVGAAGVEACVPPPGSVTVGGDCDDRDRGVAPGLHEVCDAASVDNDCSGSAEPCSRPGTPPLRFPWNGWRSGSVHGGSRTLRPTFRWEPVDGVVEYRLQLTTVCDRADFRTCTFAGEAETVVLGTLFTPDADLPAADRPPVGSRYYWRVRACVGAPPDDDARCGDWSEARYLDVGRVRADVNGDGYSDVLVGASREGVDDANRTGAVYVWLGSAGGPGEPLTVASPDGQIGGRFGECVATGDLDGDGYDDAVVGAFGHDDGGLDGNGALFAFRGGPGGLAPAPASGHLLASPYPAANLGLGCEIADLDADGDDDVAASGYAMSGQPGYVAVFLTDEGGVAPRSSLVLRSPRTADGDVFGRTLDASGDVDGDGIVDLVVGAPGEAASTGGVLLASTGRGYVFRGAPTLAAREPLVLESPAVPDPMGDGGGELGRGLCVGDVDGDGLADVVLGAWRSGALTTGSVHLFRGMRGGVETTAATSIVGGSDDALGSVLACGSLSGELAVDVIAAGHEAGERRGLALLLRSLELREVWRAGGAVGDNLGLELAVLDFDGDGVGDLALVKSGVVQLLLGTPGGDPELRYDLVYPGTITSSLFGRSVASMGWPGARFGAQPTALLPRRPRTSTCTRTRG